MSGPVMMTVGIMAIAQTDIVREVGRGRIVPGGVQAVTTGLLNDDRG